MWVKDFFDNSIFSSGSHFVWWRRTTALEMLFIKFSIFSFGGHFVW